MLSALTRVLRSSRPARPVHAMNASACGVVTSPLGNGRTRVRAMMASSFCSMTQLSAAADVATRAMPIAPNSRGPAGGKPGGGRNMPMTAVKTISETTRGLPRRTSARKGTGAEWSACTAIGFLAFRGEALLLGEILSQLADLFLGKWLGHGAHQRVVPRAIAIVVPRLHQVAVLLAGETWRLGGVRLVAFGAMARRAGAVGFLLAGVVARLRPCRPDRGRGENGRKRE